MEKYVRELERYSPQLIEKVEQVFEQSSEVISGWLVRAEEVNYDDPSVITQAVTSTLALLEVFNFDTAGFAKKMFDQFFLEFSSPKELKKEIEKLYRLLEPDIAVSVEASNKNSQYKKLKTAVRELLQEHKSKNIKTVSIEKLAMDVIHMHLNRLFIYNQRYFEMVHYYVLYRVLGKRLHTLIQL